MLVFLNKVFFYREVLLAPRPTPNPEDHPSSAVRDCLFNLFAATLHIGGRSSVRNLRTRHAVVTDNLPYLIVVGKEGPVIFRNRNVTAFHCHLLTHSRLIMALKGPNM